MTNGGLLRAALLTTLLVGCTSNEPWRIRGEVNCTALARECEHAVIEKYNVGRPDAYDLAFVEFTDRGNAFSRERVDQVLNYIQTSKATSVRGVAVIVFVHGWKHNAKYDDPNVQSFRALLKFLAASSATFGRRPIGVYIGWRGLSADAWGVTDLTYWERKAVAEQIGRAGGVTETLLRLRQITAPHGQASPAQGTPPDLDPNLFVVIGHSFGGAVVLSALNEVLIEAVISAPNKPGASAPGCVETAGFGHGVILLNPAIEATEGLHLREASRLRVFCPSQEQLMHVISTDGDTATHDAFPLGQALGLLTWSRTDLQRDYGQRHVTMAEAELDATTIGNFKALRTARIQQSTENRGEWEIFRCDNSRCGLDDTEWSNHFDAVPNDPLSFVSTDASFIKDHNDIFNCNVTAYLAAVVEAARFRRKEVNKPGCSAGETFDVLGCFKAYRKDLEKNANGGLTSFCPGA